MQWSGAGAFPFNVANEIWPLGGAATQFLLTADCAGRRSTPRARFIGKASPLIGKPCFRLSRESRTNSLAVQRKAERRPEKSVGNDLGAQNDALHV